jgi:hypothetical protein
MTPHQTLVTLEKICSCDFLICGNFWVVTPRKWDKARGGAPGGTDGERKATRVLTLLSITRVRLSSST